MEVLRGADGRRARTEPAERLRAGLAVVRHGHDAEARQRVVERNVHARLALVVEYDARLPQQQRVEQFARGTLATAAARRYRLAAVVPAPDDLHLRRGGRHAVTAALPHGVEQIPARVRRQFQQRLVNGRHRDLGACRNGLAVRLGHLDAHFCVAAHRIRRGIRFHFHAEPLPRRADTQFRQAEAIGRLAQVHEAGGRLILPSLVPERPEPFQRLLPAPLEERVPGHFVDPPAHREHRHVNVRSPRWLDLERNVRVLARDLHRARFHHTFALDRNQRRGRPERHAYLKLGGLARLVGLALGQHVHAVGVVAPEPHLAAPCHPNTRCRRAQVVPVVLRLRHQRDFPRLRERDITRQQAVLVGLSTAYRAEVLHLGSIVISIEAAHHALAAAGGDTRLGAYVHRHAGFRLALQIERQCLDGQFVRHRHPAFAAHAGDQVRGPQRCVAAKRLNLAVRIRKAGLEHQVARTVDLRQVLEHEAARTVAIEHETLLVGHQLLVARPRALVVARLIVAGPRLRLRRPIRRKAEVVVSVERQVTHAQQCRHPHRQVTGRAAGHVIDLHVHGRFGLVDERRFRRVTHADRSGQHRQAEGFHSEMPGVERRRIRFRTRISVGVIERDRVLPEFRPLRDLESVLGQASVTPLNRLRIGLPGAFVRNRQLRRQAGGQRQSPHRFLANEVLHRDGFAYAEQHTVENRLRANRRTVAAVRRHVEAPGFDTAIPVGRHERHVGVAALRARHHEVARTHRLLAISVLLERLVDLRHTGLVGHGGGHFAAVAVEHPDRCVGHGLPLVERCDPRHGILAAHLEMHAQIGHKHRGAHVHRQRLAEQCRAQRR